MLLGEGWAERNQGMLTLVGICIAALVAVAIAWYNRPTKHLDWTVIADTPILATRSAPAGLELLWKGTEVKRPRVLTVRIKNTGRKEITLDDFDGEIVVEVIDALILSSAITGQRGIRHLPAHGVMPVEFRTVSIGNALYNRGDWIDMQIVIDQADEKWETSKLQVKSVIVGQTRPGKRTSLGYYRRIGVIAGMV